MVRFGQFRYVAGDCVVVGPHCVSLYLRCVRPLAIERRRNRRLEGVVVQTEQLRCGGDDVASYLGFALQLSHFCSHVGPGGCWHGATRFQVQTELASILVLTLVIWAALQ